AVGATVGLAGEPRGRGVKGCSLLRSGRGVERKQREREGQGAEEGAMSEIRDFKDLIVWRKAMALARQVYELTRSFPNDERYCLTQQVRKAAISVPSNIAEGHTRQGKEFAHFLSIARGSLAEVECQLLIGIDLGYLREEQTITQKLLSPRPLDPSTPRPLDPSRKGGVA